MISGRGLGHTGGTLDKLESIPGYDVTPSTDRLREVVRSVGCAIVGQTARLAPADRRLYAIRDATGTVESIPLIVGSILSKKLAAGLDALVMDVKVGSGAMLPSLDRARELARAIVEVAVGNGLPTVALLTDMNQVLGRTAGNAVEVRESIDHLTGAARDERLLDVTLALCAELLVLGELYGDVAGGADGGGATHSTSGAAAERFEAMVDELGGPAGSDRHAVAASAERAGGREVEPARAGTWSRRSTCARSASPSSTSAAAGPARPTRSTTASASPRWRRSASASSPASGRWRSCTRGRGERASAPPARCARRSRSGTRPATVSRPVIERCA